MIARVWHGWTEADNADAYEHLLRTQILPGIAARRIDGYLHAQLLRDEPRDGQVEFVTICWFAHMEAVREFAGDDLTHAVVPPAAQALLVRFDDSSRHYTLEATIPPPGPSAG